MFKIRNTLHICKQFRFIKDKFIMSTSVLSESFSTKHLLNLKHATIDRNKIFQPRIHMPLNPCLSFCTNTDSDDNIKYKDPTVESKLIAFMDRWDIEKAVTLLKESIENGIIPNQGVVINLLQLLGKLGDFECLLSLREILKDNKLCANERFFSCLQEAYYNSGRVEEAVLLLRILYHDLRNYDTVDIYFTLTAMMILVHFPHRLDLIESFAKDCREKKPPDYLPTAGLWKCFMLSKNFEKAEKLVSDHEKIQEHLHQMTANILSRKNKVQVDRICILKYLSQNSANYRIKTQSKIYSSLILELGMYRFSLSYLPLIVIICNYSDAIHSSPSCGLIGIS